MKLNNNIAISTLKAILSLSLLMSFASCSNFFGEETKIDFIVPPDTSAVGVSYVPVLPNITGFGFPTQILAGNDQLLYVVDSAKQEIVSLNQAGVVLGRLRIPGVTALAQDRTLDLLALGKDSVNTGTPSEPRYTLLTTIYRIGLKNTTYGLANAVVKKKITHPFYFTQNLGVNALPEAIRFTSIAVLPDNRYYVVRTGPSKDLLTGTPDDGVLLFDAEDKFITTIDVAGDGGASFSDFFKKPFAIATYPPVGNVISATETADFVVANIDAVQDIVLKVKVIQANAGEEGISYSVKPLPTSGVAGAAGYLYAANRFLSPKGLAIASDETKYIFVTDRDSLYQFSPEGVEGVRLRASSINKGYNKVSFGGRGSGPYQFNTPRGIAYSNRIVYVADAGNGRIVRYKLTTDFE
jgi:hypothetical protein